MSRADMGMSRAIVITSGKGGTGKSTLAKELGLLLSGAGRRVVLVDMDMGMRSLDLMLGLENKIVYDLADVAEGVCRLKQALVRARDGQELYLLSAAQTRGSDALTPLQTERIIQKLRERFDFVLIDCPAGVGRGFRNAAAGADSAIIVALPDPVSLRDAERVVGLLMKCDIRDPMLVVNRVPLTRPGGGAVPVERMRQALGLMLLGWVPEDFRMSGQRPGHGDAGAAFLRIARRLMGEQVPVIPPRRAGILRRIIGAIRL